MSWTRQILNELQHGGNVPACRSTRRPQTNRAAWPASAFQKLQPPEADALACIDFGAKLMSLCELARISGVGQKLLRNLVRTGKLRPVKVPGGGRLRYSPQQLAQIIREHNEPAK